MISIKSAVDMRYCKERKREKKSKREGERAALARVMAGNTMRL